MLCIPDICPNVAETESKDWIVTGGAGFIGSNLLDRLLETGGGICIDNFHTGNENNLKTANGKGSFKLIRGNSSSITEVDKGIPTIFHLGFYSASPMYRSDPLLVSEVIRDMISVLEYARKNDSRIVFSSTSSIYNGIVPPHKEDVIPGVTDFYTEARIAAERMSELYVRLYGINVSAMRFFSVFGPHEESKKEYANLATQFYWNLRKGESPVIYGNGEQRRDFVYVEDVVNALVLAAENNKGYNVYNVGSGKNYSLNELMEKLNGLLGTSIKAKYIEMPIKNYVMETLADTTKAQEKIGFKASINLDEGLEKIKEYYR